MRYVIIYEGIINSKNKIMSGYYSYRNDGQPVIIPFNKTKEPHKNILIPVFTNPEIAQCFCRALQNHFNQISKKDNNGPYKVYVRKLDIPKCPIKVSKEISKIVESPYGINIELRQIINK